MTFQIEGKLKQTIIVHEKQRMVSETGWAEADNRRYDVRTGMGG